MDFHVTTATRQILTAKRTGPEADMRALEAKMDRRVCALVERSSAAKP